MMDQEDFERLVSKHIVNEARRLLLDKKYLELGRGTDEEIELAEMIACTLHEIAPSPKDGVTLDELTIYLFREFDNVENIDDIPDEEFISKKAMVCRAIDLLKKMALEAIEKGFSKSENATDDRQREEQENSYADIPFYICAAYSDELKTDVFFDAAPRGQEDEDGSIMRLQQFYKFLGFDSTHLDKPGDYMLTEKGAGMIRLDDDSSIKNNDDIKEQVPHQLIADIIANLKGNYNSESGLNELIQLIKYFLDLIAKAKITDCHPLSEEQIMHALIPASINATGAQLESYKTKISDVKYFVHRLQKYDIEMSRT